MSSTTQVTNLNSPSLAETFLIALFYLILILLYTSIVFICGKFCADIKKKIPPISQCSQQTKQAV